MPNERPSLPDFLKGSWDEKKYLKWLIRKARYHFKRDKERGDLNVDAAQYRKSIHKAMEGCKGRCTLTGAKLKFDEESGTPQKGGLGCHPLYMAVDHISPNPTDHGFQIICYDINDLKGHLPTPLFDALKKTKAWQDFVEKWKILAEQNPDDRSMFKKLIQTGE